MQRLTVISGSQAASVDARKACNGVKRMAAIGAAAILADIQPADAANMATKMAMEVLDAIGFDTNNTDRLESVLPMMLEATSVVLADVAARAQGREQSWRVGAIGRGSEALKGIAKSKVVARMVETSYPSDMDSQVALRLTATAALANLAVEVSRFDFGHEADACLKEGARVVISAALRAAEVITHADASRATKLMVGQSMIQSASKVYSACWAAAARLHDEHVAPLDAAHREVLTQSMKGRALKESLATINAKFDLVFSAAVETPAIYLSKEIEAVKAPVGINPNAGRLGARMRP